MSLKPHRACDIDLTTVKFPTIGMPKLDGVRGLHITGAFTGRSLKAFKNKFVGERYKSPFMAGLDGELTLGSTTAPRLCSETTGFVNRKTAKPGKPVESDDLSWNIFDYLGPDAIDKTYMQRLAMAENTVIGLDRPDIRMVPYSIITTMQELEDFDAVCIAAGYEGSIFRDPLGMHKNGKASNKAGSKLGNAYLRLKRFVDFEFKVTNLVEANENTNEKKTNELGESERSSHKENMVPKGMVGMIQGEVLEDVVYLGKTCLVAGQPVDVGPGEMPHVERKALWDAFIGKTEDCLVGQIGKAKFFPHGQKDKPRFPTWLGIRSEEDML